MIDGGARGLGACVETYLHWLHLKLGHALIDDLMTPDQAIAWHELCRGLRLGPAPLADDADEATLAATGHELDAWLEGQVAEDSPGLWLVGGATAGVCTLLHDLVLGLHHRPLPIPLLICGHATRAAIGLLDLTGPWSGLSARAALDRWWDAVELDIRRQFDRSWRAAPLRRLRACHVIAGVDELGASEGQQTAAAWAAELAAAGERVVVSSRAPDTPGLVDAPGLRRVFVLPLSQAPQDRLLAVWAREAGPWGRAAPARVAAVRATAPQLTRRPAHLGMLAVLSARKTEEPLPTDLAALQRELLAELDLGQFAHRQLMARVVADPASALDEPTRRRWLAALVAAAVDADHVELGEPLGRDERLAPFGRELLLAATRAWADGTCPMGPVLAASEARCLGRPRCGPRHDDEMARLLWLGRAAGWWGPEAIFVLRRAVPGRERLVDVNAVEIRPRPLLLALAAVDAVWAPKPAALLRAVPLGLVLAEGGTLGPVTAAALHGDSGCHELRAIRELFHRFLELELALVALAVDRSELQSEVMAMTAARDLDLDDALDLALARTGAAPLRPRRRRLDDEDRDRSAYLDLALTLAARLTPCGAPELLADLERARQVALRPSSEAPLDGTFAFAGPRPRAGGELRRRDEHRRRLGELVGFIVALLVYAIDRHLLPQPRAQLRRDEVQRLAAQLAAPEAVAAAFPEERQAQVIADWQWVMQQRWAPHRVAEALLAAMPECLALGPAEILPRGRRWLQAWLAAAGARGPAT
ncbi:MAG: hypothetical protein JNL82_00510 [Myxococcales bacterium]|nr:hypothetical protein [Myxococcales bacterium]